jgi:hypothetical protein
VEVFRLIRMFRSMCHGIKWHCQRHRPQTALHFGSVVTWGARHLILSNSFHNVVANISVYGYLISVWLSISLPSVYLELPPSIQPSRAHSVLKVRRRVFGGARSFSMPERLSCLSFPYLIRRSLLANAGDIACDRLTSNRATNRYTGGKES